MFFFDPERSPLFCQFHVISLGGVWNKTRSGLYLGHERDDVLYGTRSLNSSCFELSECFSTAEGRIKMSRRNLSGRKKVDWLQDDFRRAELKKEKMYTAAIMRQLRGKKSWVRWLNDNWSGEKKRGPTRQWVEKGNVIGGHDAKVKITDNYDESKKRYCG